MRRLQAASVALLFLCAANAEGQKVARSDTLRLTLSEALTRATRQGEEVLLARSQIELAEVQIHNARSVALPQLNANLGYVRTFASQFNTGQSFTVPDSLRFEPDSLASLPDRVKYLEDRTAGAAIGALGSLFGNLPFGQENSYTATLSGSQLLYSGGRVGAALDAAKNLRDAASLQLSEQLSEIELSVRNAYYRAQLAAEMANISLAAVEQAEQFLAQERLRERAGTASELDVLRAEVELANLRPQLVTTANAAEISQMDLRRLVNVPAQQPLALVDALPLPSAEMLAPPQPPADWVESRPAVQAAERNVRIRELAVRVAKAAYLPSVSLRMNYGRTAFPGQVFQFSNEWRTDWTAALTVDFPIFDGLRREAQIDEAQVQHTNEQLRLAQLRESVQLQYQQAVGERQRAAVTITARQQTVTQAQRVHDLTVLRYNQGLATQLEVSDARLALLQARNNLVQAITDFYIAEATVARALGRSTTGN
jgi:outer membrane protein